MTGVVVILAASSNPPAPTINPNARNGGPSAANSFAFPSCTVVVPGYTPTLYNWRFANVGLGTWTITSGQGTATASATVSGATTPAIDYVADFICDVTVNGTVYSSNPCTLTYTRS